MQITTEATWYNQMAKKLQINGKSERTQEAYLRSVRQLKEHYEKDPSRISEDELEQYFLYRRNESRWAPKSLRLCYYGIKFSYRFVLNTDFNLFSILKAQREERFPEIPFKEIIHKALSCVSTFHNFVFFSTVYSCGLRLQEALNLLRRYWKTHRNPILIFPALGRGHTRGPVSTVPMNHASVQGALSPCRPTSAGFSAPISDSLTRRCLPPPPRPCSLGAPNPPISPAIPPGSSACCTPGAGRCSIILTFIMSFLEERSLHQTTVGTHPPMRSICRFASCRRK